MMMVFDRRLLTRTESGGEVKRRLPVSGLGLVASLWRTRDLSNRLNAAPEIRERVEHLLVLKQFPAIGTDPVKFSYGPMTKLRVLIVEDDPLIALDVEQALTAAGYEVAGSASSEAEAVALAGSLKPDLAIVDISLNPGDGRVVAKALCRDFKVAVLFATGQCDEVEGMRGTGAIACLPKPYTSDLVPAALDAVLRLRDGDHNTPLPDHMIALAA